MNQDANKYPDLINRMHQLNEEDLTLHKHFMHSLDWDITIKTLKSVFGKGKTTMLGGRNGGIVLCVKVWGPKYDVVGHCFGSVLIKAFSTIFFSP